MSCATFHPFDLMSLINLEQFVQLREAYPELAQCYHPDTFTIPKDAAPEADIFEDDWETHA